MAIAGVYVPTHPEVEAFQKAQNAHSQAIMGVIGPDASHRLGIDSMSPVREMTRCAFFAPAKQLPNGQAKSYDESFSIL